MTVFTGINLDVLSISYIDNRASPGTSELLPGPLGYQSSTYSMKIGVVSTAMFLFNNWLADGLLVSFVSNSVVPVSNTDHPSSSIDVTLFMP